MAAKVRHLVRVVRLATELDRLCDAVRALYRDSKTTRIVRGDACRADPHGNEWHVSQRINELAIAKMHIDDPTIAGPELLPDGRRIDFVVDRGLESSVSPCSAPLPPTWRKAPAS
jgi:hypothetical protein